MGLVKKLLRKDGKDSELMIVFKQARAGKFEQAIRAAGSIPNKRFAQMHLDLL